MNIIFVLLITISVVFSIINGRLEEFTQSIFDAGKSAVEISLFLLGIIALWMGIIKILEDSGVVHNLSRFFRPLIKKLFKNVPDDHPAITSITLNFIANLFGIGNAATPLGIKAMQDLQTLNTDKEETSFEMMLFVVINTSSIQILPFTVIGILSTLGSTNPTAIVLPTILATILSSIFAVTNLFIFRRFFGK